MYQLEKAAVTDALSLEALKPPVPGCQCFRHYSSGLKCASLPNFSKIWILKSVHGCVIAS